MDVLKRFELVFKLLGTCSYKPINILKAPKLVSNKCFVNEYRIWVLLKSSDTTEIADVLATRRKWQLQIKIERGEGITRKFRDLKCGQWTACAETEQCYVYRGFDFPKTEMNVFIGNMIRSCKKQEEN